MPPPGDSEKQDAARQAVDILHEISTILNCHLDRRTLSVCISMVENGVNPEALANVVQYLRKEAQKVNFANSAATGNQ
ncbi:mitotic-spindle organizing protein associated with a ring of gamma-tubulin 1 [Xylaria curta]|nr:mitotic-spindle organizing protein associated with a ring of gamma-tubulin 1 [Xylaria curta]